jgi:mannosyltransferase
MRGLSAVVQLPRYEGYGMAPLEAMASAVPFVATDQGYYRSFSGQGSTGLIVAETDAARALQTLLADPARHTAMSKAARDAAETHYSVRAEAAGINAVYEQLWQGA